MLDFVFKYWLETLFGLVCALLVGLWRNLSKRVRQEHEEQAAIKAGLQALLRAQMVNDFNRYSEKGFAPLYARDNFQNCWKQYERLGENGVIQDLHDKFMRLPVNDERGTNHV